MFHRALSVTARALLLATLVVPGEGHATNAASASPTTTDKASSDQAAYDSLLQQRARRKEAEARLQQMLANPPQNAPGWMKRMKERSGATGNPGASGTRSAP
jgi:hypothetical protein